MIDCQYLNNSGSRFKTSNMQFMLFNHGQLIRMRKADCYESLGNFSLHCFRYQGKHYKGFARDNETFNGLPIIDLDRCKVTE